MILATVQLLHIPDGFLSVPVALVCWLVTFVVLLAAVRQTRDAFDESLAPLAGIMAAFIFAAQMLNFPVAGGTSGHMLGGVLAAVTLGPWVGMLVMTAVVGLQALLFQDGGLLVMGANILNMGVLTVLVGIAFYRLGDGRSFRFKMGLTAVAAWLSVMAGALATSLELWLSGTTSLNVVVPAMLGVHALIGIGEAVISIAALNFIWRARPDLLAGEEMTPNRGWVLPGLLVALGVALLSPLAVADPDGLERVAADLGFLNTAQAAPISILSNYNVPFLANASVSTLVAGLVGTLAVAGITAVLLRTLRRQPVNSKQ
ncbi:MAG: energy-coupling factor ABC transporter permease [Anaerolineae bacterium]